MLITTTNSQQITANVMEGGNQKAVLAASIRPEQAININVEILDQDYAQAHSTEIADAIGAFLADVLTRAQATGIPVPVAATATAAE